MSESKINDGGAAFPQLARDAWDHIGATGGMSLRDWLAGQAVVGAVAYLHALDSSEEADGAARSIAGDAYRLADAMLAARKAESLPSRSSEEG